jgi:Flp pilus assembly pilin Flp
LWSDEDALTTVEYALLLALVFVVGLLAWQSLGTSVNSSVEASNEALPPND